MRYFSNKKGVLLYNKIHRIHRASMVSRENPERLERGYKFIKNRSDILEYYDLLDDYEPASREDIMRVHERPYVDFIEGYCSKGGGFLGDSTYVQKGSCKAARYSAGGAIEVCKRVISDYRTGFALIRPPGHHALPDNYGGYCLYNNAAIAARWLQENRKRKIMIIDWDGHAANGTMRTFYEDPDVLTISIHRDPEGFYPHDGFTHQIGKAAGRGYSVNVCLPRGAGDSELRRSFRDIVFPLADVFDPDFVIGCNGFDSHQSDSVVGLNYSIDSYHYISSEIGKRYENKHSLLMEGGYEKFNGKLLHVVLSGLLGKKNPYDGVEKSLSSSIVQGGSVCKDTINNISELKRILKDFPLGAKAFS